ncbi:MAG: hypothetical protein HZB56_14820 [Deltaproteobacteria bacterium]|nr:hypothetical protein [Deltaproteobacteria bacterium]
MTTTTFARPPRNCVATLLQIATVAVALLLGAAFATSMFADGAEAQLRAALAPPAEQARS